MPAQAVPVEPIGPAPAPRPRAPRNGWVAKLAGGSGPITATIEPDAFTLSQWRASGAGRHSVTAGTSPPPSSTVNLAASLAAIEAAFGRRPADD